MNSGMGCGICLRGGAVVRERGAGGVGGGCQENEMRSDDGGYVTSLRCAVDGGERSMKNTRCLEMKDSPDRKTYWQ